MRFFFDTCISPRLVKALSVIVEHQHIEIIHSNTLFAPETADVVWISALGREGDWVIISADPRISRGKAERAAWRESGLTAFFFSDGWSGRTIYEQGADLIRRWPDIHQSAKTCTKGSGFLITKGKDFKQLF